MAIRVRINIATAEGRRLETVAVLNGGFEVPDATFRVLVSEADGEVLVSDLGIDALGIRIETFNPPRWRFADENQARETAPPQYW